jgi:hypothetical protein
MTVKQMVKTRLQESGYGGLMNDYCGCVLRDLMPCNGDGIDQCRASYEWKPKDFHDRYPESEIDLDKTAEFIMSGIEP